MIAISRFNNQNMSKRIIMIGLLQLVSFLIPFYILVPQYGNLGAAFSLMIAMILSSILAMHWLERYIVKYIINSSLAVFVGVLLAYSSGAVLNHKGLNR